MKNWPETLRATKSIYLHHHIYEYLGRLSFRQAVLSLPGQNTGNTVPLGARRNPNARILARIFHLVFRITEKARKQGGLWPTLCVTYESLSIWTWGQKHTVYISIHKMLGCLNTFVTDVLAAVWNGYYTEQIHDLFWSPRQSQMNIPMKALG